ncbi:lysylphosphatidylglycerol synthase domain-containing protein [Balneolaceae bacterium ANBcel3]|nr:lysylphosphatidylglycerol synthase domain-containing protein [Balneolaceae bacterium ANBcel3]
MVSFIRKRLLTRRNLLSGIGLVLFIIAFRVLRQEIQQFSWSTFMEHISMIPVSHLAGAMAASVAGYLILTAYDKLALHYVGIRIPWKKYAKASFLGFAFSHNITPSLLVGGTIRYRIYSSMGISGFDVTKVVGFCALTLWIGFMSLGGLAFTSTFFVIPSEVSFPLPGLPWLGILFLILVALYLILCRNIRSTLVFRKHIFSLPKLPLAIGQVVAGSLDLAVSSLVLYLLLPPIPELSWPAFLAIYLLGFMGGIISQVPGGLGVIETILVLMLGAYTDTTLILSAVLAYRLLYFILPLFAALVLLAIHEVRQRLKKRKS